MDREQEMGCIRSQLEILRGVPGRNDYRQERIEALEARLRELGASGDPHEIPGAVILSRLPEFRGDHLVHKIPIGALVEVEVQIYSTGTSGSEVDLKGKCKLVVIGHQRDCDGTPLYGLSNIPVEYPTGGLTQEALVYNTFAKVRVDGYGEESLKWNGSTVVPVYEHIHEWLRG